MTTELGLWYQEAVIGNIPMPTRRNNWDTNEHRWKLFVEPFMQDGEGRRFIELGSNAGFYLRKARSLGFEVIGVERDPIYIAQAKYWEESDPMGTRTTEMDFNDYVLPVVHTVLLAHVLYYLNHKQIASLVHKLRNRAMNVIVISRHERLSRIKYPCEKEHILRFFSGWEAVEGGEDRKHYSVLFKNPKIVELDAKEIAVYDRNRPIKGALFYSSFSALVSLIGSGKPFDFTQTDYYRYLVRFHPGGDKKRRWYFKRYLALIENIKMNGIAKPLLVVKNNSDNYIIYDGSHRLIIANYLGINKILSILTHRK